MKLKRFGQSERSWRSQLNLQERTTKGKQLIFTNFADFDLPAPPVCLQNIHDMNVMNAVKCLDKFFATLNMSFQTKGFNYQLLVEDGLLTIPLWVEINNTQYAVFFIYNEQEAAQYLDAKKQLTKTCIHKTLYISTIDITAVKNKNSCLDLLSFSDLVYHEQWVPAGIYGMWSKSKKSPLFISSKTKEYLDIIDRSTRGYRSYFFGYILSELEIEGYEKAHRIPLPDKSMEITVKGPELKDIIISFSKEKGIRFHFPIEHTSRKYREYFLEQISASFKAYHLMLNLREVEKDEVLDAPRQDWYPFMCEVMEEKENRGEWTDMIGAVQIE